LPLFIKGGVYRRRWRVFDWWEAFESYRVLLERKIAEYKSLLDRNMLKRVEEVGEEYGIDVLLVGEEYTSFLCLLYKTSSRHRRIKRGYSNARDTERCSTQIF